MPNHGGRLADDDDDVVQREPLVTSALEIGELGGKGGSSSSNGSSSGGGGKGMGSGAPLSSPGTVARALGLPLVKALADPKSAAVASCFAYTFCSITMVLANKALASGYHADIDFLVIAFQGLCAVVLVLGCDAAGVIELGTRFDARVAVQWLPVNVFFVAMLSTGFLSLKHLNVPMVTIFKNLTNVGIMWGEWSFYGQAVSGGAVLSCAIMILGAVLAAANDITFSAQVRCVNVDGLVGSAGVCVAGCSSLFPTVLGDRLSRPTPPPLHCHSAPPPRATSGW